jgi:hypothetical protein
MGQNSSLYVLINNDSWKSLVKVKSYSLEYKFDEDVPWRGNSTATEMGLYGKTDKHRVVRSPADMTDALVFEPIAKFARDVGWTIIAQQPRPM